MQFRQGGHVTMLGLIGFMLWAVATAYSQPFPGAPSITVYADPG